MSVVDLRSDTVTRPSKGMREAMARAEVGDDVYGEDPTARRLEEMAARLVGKEAALFVPSGTMANQVSLRAAARPGDVVLAADGQPVKATADLLAAVAAHKPGDKLVLTKPIGTGIIGTAIKRGAADAA